jgi:hypothetical protein
MTWQIVLFHWPRFLTSQQGRLHDHNILHLHMMPLGSELPKAWVELDRGLICAPHLTNLITAINSNKQDDTSKFLTYFYHSASLNASLSPTNQHVSSRHRHQRPKTENGPPRSPIDQRPGTTKRGPVFKQAYKAPGTDATFG